MLVPNSILMVQIGKTLVQNSYESRQGICDISNFLQYHSSIEAIKSNGIELYLLVKNCTKVEDYRTVLFLNFRIYGSWTTFVYSISTLFCWYKILFSWYKTETKFSRIQNRNLRYWGRYGKRRGLYEGVNDLHSRDVEIFEGLSRIIWANLDVMEELNKWAMIVVYKE